jgi:hypothetical protein
MSILDDLKAKASGLLEGKSDKVSEGLDKARGFAEDKAGGEFGEQIKGGIQKAKDALGGISGKGGSS